MIFEGDNLEIQYFNRHTDQLEIEKVYGDKAVRWLYQTPSGQGVSGLLALKPVSYIYGKLQDAPWSKKKIAPFIRDFDINMEDYLPDEEGTEKDPYPNFNRFFVRRFRPGARPFVSAPEEMPAFAEARYFGHRELTNEVRFPVKGAYLSARELLQSQKWAKVFDGGPALIARLCPVDYHRFHFPDDGRLLDSYPLPGELHSVNPMALQGRPDIFLANEREVSILETENFGKLAYVEVGAIMVGKIVQTYKGREFERGNEKGYFLFGGSSIVVLGEPGKWAPSQDILDYTAKGIETYVHLGTPVGNRYLVTKN